MAEVRMMPSTGDGKGTKEFKNSNIETDDVATKVRKAAEKSAAGFAAALAPLGSVGGGADFSGPTLAKANRENKAAEKKKRFNQQGPNS